MSDDKNVTLKQIRRKHILMTLDSTAWDLAKASKLLDLSVKELRREIRKIGLERNKNPETK
jgi:transcriptional regulator with GAF, ATPase, and Fis domain